MSRLVILVLLGLLLGGCGKPAPSSPTTTPPPSQPQPGAPAADLVNALRRDDEGLVVETAPNGAKMLNLQGRLSNVLVARRNPDGTITVTTATGVDQMGALVAPGQREFR